MDNLFQVKKDLDSCGIFLSFSGPISQNLMVELGDILKHRMELAEATTPTILRVFSILVEQSQNIIRHSAEKIPEYDSETEKMMFGTIAVGYKEGKYFVIGGNKIENDDVEKLKEKLTELQQMSKEDLKQSYRQQRKKDAEEGHKGAGLGLIELARKSSEPIEFCFEKIDDEFSFFSLKTLI